MCIRCSRELRGRTAGAAGSNPARRRGDRSCRVVSRAAVCTERDTTRSGISPGDISDAVRAAQSPHERGRSAADAYLSRRISCDSGSRGPLPPRSRQYGRIEGVYKRTASRGATRLRDVTGSAGAGMRQSMRRRVGPRRTAVGISMSPRDSHLPGTTGPVKPNTVNPARNDTERPTADRAPRLRPYRACHAHRGAADSRRSTSFSLRRRPRGQPHRS
jgi:hypothetical protein